MTYRAAIVGYTGWPQAGAHLSKDLHRHHGHAEAVEVEFDPERVSFEQLVGRFWELHDPTQVNRQGPDFGTQYRTAIFTHSPEQAAAAEASRDRAQTRFSQPIATQIEEAGTFWPGEDYHQRSLEKRGLATCAV